MEHALNGNGHRATGHADAAVLFFFEEGAEIHAAGGRPTLEPTPVSRLAVARAALRDAQQAEWDERQRVARAGDVATPAHAALLLAWQARTQAAEAAVTELRRRAVSLRQAIALAEEAMSAQRRIADRLRRELAELGD